jgi:putative cardiolipin synthase
MQGANVCILTNSLAATDVAVVHSGYVKYREPLLQAGVRIYEMKSAPTFEEERGRMRLGSSRASLHTKAAVVDAERVFVGSFNIDPRSAQLNCEMGVWIRSPKLAQTLIESFRFGADPRRSLALSINANGALEWAEHVDGKLVKHHREPHASWPRRLIARLLESLPIESQL